MSDKGSTVAVIDAHTETSLVNDDDDMRLHTMGYAQYMKREFGIWSMTAFCLSGLGLLPSIGGTLWFSLGYLGLVGCMYFIQTVVLSLAEFGSAYPTAGGLYYLTEVAAPARWKSVACWVTAWSMIVGAALGCASTFMTQAQMVTAFAVMVNENWTPTAWQIYCIYLLHIVVCGIIMCFPSRALAKMSEIFAWLGTVTFFAFLIAMPIKTLEYNTAKQLFFDSYNQTKWSSSGLVFLPTFLSLCWTVAGYDSTVHLAEEATAAARFVPKAMLMLTLGVSIFGYLFNVVLAYCAYDIDTIMVSPLGRPLGALLVSACGNGALTKTLWFCTVLSNLGVVFVMTTSSSYIYFAYARDGALPFSKWMSHVNAKTKTPINATFTLCACIVLLGAISLGSSVVLNGLFAGSALIGAVGYLMPVLMRCTHEDNPGYVPGPFSLGEWSKSIQWIAVIWTLFTLPLFFLPEEPHPTAKTMKWTVPIYFGILAIIMPWYYLRARRWFVGHAKNVELAS